MRAGLRASQLVGSYRIDGLIASGGMGDVYRAAHIILPRLAAIKVLQLEVVGTVSAAERMLQEARILAAIEHSPFRNLITNAVGGSKPGVRAEVHKVELEAGDVVLLCSDGLTTMVPDEDIAAILSAASSPDAACQQLIARANELGGHDNITAVVARFDAPAMESAMESAPAAS